MNRISAAVACLACLSLWTTPAAALQLPRAGPAQVRPGYDVVSENVEHRRRRHRDDGIDAGDVIAGVLILGGIAAIASAASGSRDGPEPYPRSEDPRYRETGGTYQSTGMDRAVDMCVSEIERRGDRVASVDAAARSGEGWFVSGEVEDAAPFTCRIDNDGRIGAVEIGDSLHGSGDDTGDRDAWPSGSVTDRQYDDATYARARSGLSTPSRSAYGW